MNLKTNDKSSGLRYLLRPVILGGIVGFAVILIMFVIMALILSTGIFSLEASTLLASVSVAIGSFFAGLISAKKSGKNGLLTGAITGSFLFLIFTVISLLVFKSSPTAATLVRLILFVIGSSIGGIIGVGSSDKRKIV